MPYSAESGDEPAQIPFPERFTLFGDVLVAPEVTVSRPLRVPVAVGRKVTLAVQLPPAGMDPPQSLVCWKSPVASTLLIAIGSSGLPLVRTTVFGRLVVLSAWLPKLSVPGDRLRGRVPEPLRVE